LEAPAQYSTKVLLVACCYQEVDPESTSANSTRADDGLPSSVILLALSHLLKTGLPRAFVVCQRK
jgi:hypothetical protein